MARGQRSPEGQAAALELLQALGEGYRLLCLYRCVPTRSAGAAAGRGLSRALSVAKRADGQMSVATTPPDLAPRAMPERRCQEAIDAFSRLPANHYQTGWVLNQVSGRRGRRARSPLLVFIAQAEPQWRQALSAVQPL